MGLEVEGKKRQWLNNLMPQAKRSIYKEDNMFGIGMPELLVILVIVLVIFGANKLPQIGEGIGKGIRNFKKATKESEEIDVTPKKTDEISDKK
jgi:sec-independent protein translocase protein TatA